MLMSISKVAEFEVVTHQGFFQDFSQGGENDVLWNSGVNYQHTSLYWKIQGGGGGE